MRFWLFLLSLVAAGEALAHGDLHLQIAEVTRQIEKNPKNAELYLKRGELHRAHQEWDPAQADYDRALVLDPSLHVIDFTRGRMFLEANWPHSAKICLDRFLLRQTNHVEARVARARALVKLTKHLEAARDYTAAIQQSAAGRPELYIERAQALTEEGTNHFGEALRGLDEGMQKLGTLVTLQLYAIDIELKQKKYDAALDRLEKVAAQSPRKETWLARRGEILQQAGRNPEARRAYEDALKAMASLPPARRNVPAMVELERRIKEALAQTSKPEAGSTTSGRSSKAE
ncbi:MAG: tetratricopeptide repeat protein [Verrucomicrobia subdivision 3 bacterium]|nr:tetratricopeptide repeat protein [Limisphaerales bacterium]